MRHNAPEILARRVLVILVIAIGIYAALYV
jgi:hypothetical protein